MSNTRDAVASLRARGLSQPEIARQLNLAPTTVSYHVERLDRPSDSIEAPDVPEDALLTRRRTREKVATLIAEGVAHTEIARRLGISKATVSYHAKRLGAKLDDRFGRRYDWGAIQRYYDEGHSVRECMKVFGFSSASWFEASKRGAVIGRPSTTPIEALLIAGVYRGRDNLKLRLLKEGLKEVRCERCGVTEWLGQPLSMALHHINGDRLDNRLNNLELLCPNCHSQTDTYSGRNGHRRRRRVGPELAA